MLLVDSVCCVTHAMHSHGVPDGESGFDLVLECRGVFLNYPADVSIAFHPTYQIENGINYGGGSFCFFMSGLLMYIQVTLPTTFAGQICFNVKRYECLTWWLLVPTVQVHLFETSQFYLHATNCSLAR